ncbi:MAG TPA: hypothetical protein PKA64_13150 [Myxococcota bacterium]|nr:hypothetical protein [Myxococcota bacterium]
MSLPLLALLAACAVDAEAPLAAAQAPTPPFDLQLEVGNMVANELVHVDIHGAPPGSIVQLRHNTGGLGAGRCPGIFGGQCLDIVEPLARNFVRVSTDGAGEASVDLFIPAGRAGQYIGVQGAVEPGTGELTNPVGRLIGDVGTPIDVNGDLDSDGFTIAEGDCADFTSAIHPAADDPEGDGIDSNCDDEDGCANDCCGMPGNLVPNCSFDASVAGWSVEIATGASHEASDGHNQVGAARVVSISQAGVGQALYLSPCFEVSPSTSYDIGGWFRVASGGSPRCNTELVQYSSTTCTSFAGTYGTGAGTLISAAQFDTFLFTNLVTSGSAHSAQVRSNCIQSSNIAFELLVDDVFLQPH